MVGVRRKSTADRALRRGRGCYARREWADACRFLAAADQAAPLAPVDLERLAWSAVLTARDDEFIRLTERRYHAHRACGEALPAARAAFWCGMRLSTLGEAARATGWFGRFQQLVERASADHVEQGYLRLATAHRDLAGGDYAAAVQNTVVADEIGERFADADLVNLARMFQGRALLHQDHFEDGLARLDEAMLAATAGELSAFVTGLVYCSVIDSCREVYALDRFREWTAALAAWCDLQPQLVAFTGRCLLYRSEIMQFDGAWGDAIAAIRHACDLVAQGVDPDADAAAHYRQGELLRLRGEFDAAEAAYHAVGEAGGEPQPGLALLRLAQGRDEEAAGALRRALHAATGRARRARFFPAYVEVMLAVGADEDARRGATELARAATNLGNDMVAAMAAHADGAVRLATGDAAGARPPLRQACAAWQRLGAPYPAARLRVLEARACRAVGNDGAASALAEAHTVFAELGAAPDLARVEGLMAEADPTLSARVAMEPA